MATTFELKRFSISDYAKMLESRILSEDDRVELIDGEVRRMSPIGTRHHGMVNWLNHRLMNRVRDKAIISIQGPIQLDDYSEPEPDVAVLRWRADFYRSTKPQPQDVLLIIEVADSSLQYDREEKLPRYAAAGIPEVWIIDLDENRPVIEQYATPQDGKYTKQEFLTIGDTFVSLSIPETIRLAVAEIYG